MLKMGNGIVKVSNIAQNVQRGDVIYVIDILLGGLELWFLPKLVVTSIIVLALFLLLGAAHFNSRITAQIRSLTECNKLVP